MKKKADTSALQKNKALESQDPAQQVLVIEKEVSFRKQGDSSDPSKSTIQKSWDEAISSNQSKSHDSNIHISNEFSIEKKQQLNITPNFDDSQMLDTIVLAEKT